MTLASRYLAERGEELLAWIILNLAQTRKVLLTGTSCPDTQKTAVFPNPAFPKDRDSRYQIFRQLREISMFIGSKNRTFTGNPFDFVSITLENEPVYTCMLSIAGYDMDEQICPAICAKFLCADTGI